MNRKFSLILASLALVTVLAACGTADDNNNTAGTDKVPTANDSMTTEGTDSKNDTNSDQSQTNGCGGQYGWRQHQHHCW